MHETSRYRSLNVCVRVQKRQEENNNNNNNNKTSLTFCAYMRHICLSSWYTFSLRASKTNLTRLSRSGTCVCMRMYVGACACVVAYWKHPNCIRPEVHLTRSSNKKQISDSICACQCLYKHGQLTLSGCTGAFSRSSPLQTHKWRIRNSSPMQY
jgi:hypothetical protein